MRPHAIAAWLVPLALLGSTLTAQPVAIGGDLYVGGATGGGIPAAERDLFAGGPAVEVDEEVAEDAHVAGFSVRVSAATGGDLYAAGGDVSLEAPVGDDLSAFGFSVTIGPAATVGGNARLGGGSVRIEAPIAGSLAASGGTVTLASRIAGDVSIAAGNVEFGPGAEVGGMLHIAASGPIEVPETVAPPDRVVVELIEPGAGPGGAADWPADWAPNWAPNWAPAWAERWMGMGEMDRDWHAPGPFAWSAGALLTLAFLLALGAAALALMPARIEALRARAAGRPWLVLLLGILGLSALIGLIPVSAATLIGLPLVPIAILALILLWTLGYLLGGYVVAMALLDGLRREAAPHGMAMRLGALALALLIAAMLNFVPILGWMANLVLGFLGIGAMVLAAGERLAPAAAPSSGLPDPGRVQ